MEIQLHQNNAQVQQLQSYEHIIERVAMVQKVYKDLMQVDQHYGKIPGTDKDTLYKAGAEKLALAFNLASEYQIERRQLQGAHVEYQVLCKIIDRGTGQIIGEGVGICSTMESKYRYRNQDTGLPLPSDYQQNKGAYKAKGFTAKKYNNKWIWYEKVENPDIADQYNTVIKMSKKRAYVDAIITCTAASDIFTQDVEDFADEEGPVQQETSLRTKGDVSMRMYEKPRQEAPVLSEKEKFSACVDLIEKAKEGSPEKMKKALLKVEGKLEQFSDAYQNELGALLAVEYGKLPADLKDPVKEEIEDMFLTASAPPSAGLFDDKGMPV